MEDYFCVAAHKNHRLIHRVTQSVGARTDGLVLRHWHLITVRCPSTELLRWTCSCARQGSGPCGSRSGKPYQSTSKWRRASVAHSAEIQPPTGFGRSRSSSARHRGPRSSKECATFRCHHQKVIGLFRHCVNDERALHHATERAESRQICPRCKRQAGQQPCDGNATNLPR